MIFLIQVERSKKIGTGSVLTNIVLSSCFWVERVYTYTSAFLIRLQILTTGLIRSGMKDSKLTYPTRNIGIPHSEDKQRNYKVIERVDVIQPMSHLLEIFHLYKLWK
jgi:hypothetical protein